MTTPTQQLQEETIRDLAARLKRNEYTVEQALRMSYILSQRHADVAHAAALKKIVMEHEW